MAQSKALRTYLALLRGINVGGKNKLPMKDLTRLFEDAGCLDVCTFIQSGNVIFQATSSVAHRLAERITHSIEQNAGLRIPVVLRTAEELDATIQENPFPGAEKMLHVYFLASLPNATDVAALEPHRSPPDTFLVRKRDIYVQLPNGMGRTKLTNAYFDSKLSTISTARNWNTVLQLNKLLKS